MNAVMTKPTVGDSWRLARRHLSEDLLSEDQAQHLQDLSDQLPGDLHCALDVSLADEFDEPAPPRLELSVSSPQQADDLPELLGHPYGAILREWIDGKIPTRAISGFSYSLPLVSDLETALKDVVPSVQLERTAPPQWSMDSFLPLFHRRQFTEQQKFFLLRLGHQLPPTGRPFHITSLGDEGLRFRTFDWSAQRVLPFLHGFSLAQLASDVSSLLPLWAAAEQRMVTFDFGDEDFLPRLRLECSFEQRKGDEPRWQELLEDLAEREMATPEAADAVLEWAGQSEGDLERRLELMQWQVSSEAPPEARALLAIRRSEAGAP